MCLINCNSKSLFDRFKMTDEYCTLNQNIPAFLGPTEKHRSPAGYDAITTRAAKVKYLYICIFILIKKM